MRFLIRFEASTRDLTCNETENHSALSNQSGAKELYIHGVCFSPDGKYLGTGAKDGQMQVRMHSHYLASLEFLMRASDLG